MATTSPNRIGKEFEQQTAALLEQLLPHCYLTGVPIFRADAAMAVGSMANELDFILHLKEDRRHTLLIIECKSCLVTGKGDGRGNHSPPTPASPWIAHYPRDNKEKPIKEQLRAQRQALLTNLEPLDGDVRVHAVVVATQANGLPTEPGHITTQELPSFELSLVRAERFAAYLQSLLAGKMALRVQQSEILRRIRQGQPVAALGHPEIYNAIEYTRRCRAFIDSEIFLNLKFTAERWAINGSAGMGKSVLLIYATMVFITDRYVDCLRDGSRFLQTFGDDAARIGLPPLEKRRVWVVAHSEKQRDMLERMFVRFNDLYGEVDSYNEYRRVKPEFRVFGAISDLDCNILLVDEAHDLGSIGEKRIREWHERNPGNYLVIACDRHQKLRLSQDETRMIQGINFSRCTKKLSRNYRNPFSTYAGSLSLLFRWFAPAGPMILPKPKQLQDEFGFGEVRLEQPGEWLLRSRNDAHPANNWSHVLSTFPSAETGYRQLVEFPLRKEHVLWIRFTPEESDFNYESLQHWSYHSVFGADASDLLDKYVKGQEFPVVVIEGVPEMFAWSAAEKSYPEDAAQAKIAMWQARRQVYLAASRANVFLYFILPASTPADVKTEFAGMFQQLACQPAQESPSGTLWDVRVKETSEVETFESYVDAIETEAPAAPAAGSEPARYELPPSPAADVPTAATATGAIPAAIHSTAISPATIRENAFGGVAGTEAVTTIAEFAQQQGIALAILTEKLAKKGYKNLEPTAPVRMEYMLRFLTTPDEPERPKPTSSAAAAEPQLQAAPELAQGNPPIVSERPIPALSENPKAKPPRELSDLGPTATIADIARVLRKSHEEVIRIMAFKGFRELKPSSKVSVSFVMEAIRANEPTKTISSTAPSSEVKSFLRPHQTTLEFSQPTPKPTHPSSPQSRPPTTVSQILPPPSTAQNLRNLANVMLLPPRLVASFLEAEGATVSGPNSTITPADANNLLQKLIGRREATVFHQISKHPIKLKELAHHLGLRPYVVARDLMQDRIMLSSEDRVPYVSLVRLCFYYKKALPTPPGKNPSKS